MKFIMGKNASVFKKLLWRNVLIAIISFAIVISVVCVYVCRNNRENEIKLINSRIDKYISSVYIPRSNCIQKSDFIVRNQLIIRNLNETKDDSLSLLDASDSLLDSIGIINNSHNPHITIYTANELLYENRYINQMSRINSGYLRARFAEAKSNFIWEDGIFFVENRTPYFMFYRDMKPYADAIISIKVFLPEITEDYPGLSLQKNDNKFTNSAKYITEPIAGQYSIVAEIDNERLLRSDIRTALFFLLVLLIFFVALAYITININEKTTSTINKLIQEIDVHDYLNTEWDLSSDDSEEVELKIIKKAIGTLVTNIKNASHDMYKIELEKRRIELNMLQNQIDPHMLYNSLTTISYKAFENNDTEIIEIIDNLVGYYRLVVAKGSETITVADEIEMLKKFVMINEISHDKKYNFVADVEEDVLKCYILRMLLQPFVENSIVHGLSGNREGCEITLRCKRQSGYLIFEICDNGYGMDEATVKKLNNIDMLDEGFAIKNTFERIHLFYGDTYGMFFESGKNIGTKVTIKIKENTNFDLRGVVC